MRLKIKEKNKIKAIEEHGKQLIQSNALVKNDYDSENNYRLHLNHKKICHELVDVRKNETNTFREKTNYNDLTYYFF